MPYTETRRLIKQKARSHPLPLLAIGLLPLVSTWFQVLLTPLAGVLFIFRSPYYSTIGHQVVFSLRGWSPRIPTEFRVFRSTWENGKEGISFFAYGILTLCDAGFHLLRLNVSFVTSRLDSGPDTPFPATPYAQRPEAYMSTVWAISLSLAATKEIASLSSPVGT